MKQTPCYSSYLPSGFLLSSSLKALSSTYALVFVRFLPRTSHKGKAARMKSLYGFKYPFILFFSDTFSSPASRTLDSIALKGG